MEVVHIKKNLEKIKHPPLLYIIQSSTSDIQVSMQNEMKSKSVKKPLAEVEIISTKDDIQTVKQKNFKDFNKWSIEEKILYFVDLPENRKKNICRILTKENEIVGKIINYEKGVVEVSVPVKGPSEKIIVHDILNIEVIGV